MELILISGELRSLIRNMLERIFKFTLKKKFKNKKVNIIYNLSVRVISSLIAIYIFSMIKDNIDIRKYVSYFMICVFIYLIYIYGLMLQNYDLDMDYLYL